jgi:hypothetical protein
MLSSLWQRTDQVSRLYKVQSALYLNLLRSGRTLQQPLISIAEVCHLRQMISFNPNIPAIPPYVVDLASTGGGSYQLTSVILTLMENFDTALSAYPSSAASHDSNKIRVIHIGMEDLGDWDQLISVARNRTVYFCSTDVYQTIQYKYIPYVRAKFWGIAMLWDHLCVSG